MSHFVLIRNILKEILRTLSFVVNLRLIFKIDYDFLWLFFM